MTEAVRLMFAENLGTESTLEVNNGCAEDITSYHLSLLC